MVATQPSEFLELKNSPDFANGTEEERKRLRLFCGIAVAAYFVIRIFAWRQTTLLEDHDSISYLESIKVFLTGDFQRIFHLSPDTAPLYPLGGALFSLPGWSVETGARLCSLVSSLVLAISLILIGQRFLSPTVIGLGLLALAFNPSMIPLSFSVLTEPIFIAVAYVGLWLFWRQYQHPTKSQGVLLGVVFGLSFLARTEGIIFLAVVPFWQAAHFWFFQRAELAEPKASYDFKRLLVWTLCFVMGFIAISTPQVWRVSSLMGRFAINGRQAWELILNNPDGKSVDEKIYGLEYSPSQINLEYIQSHPETLAEFESSISLSQFAKTMVRNFTELYQKQFGILLGPLGLILFGVGMLGLINQKRSYEVFLVLAFICSTLVAPLVHDVEMRHIAIIGPIMMLIEGCGLFCLPALLLSPAREGKRGTLLRKSLPAGLMALLILFNAHPLLQTLRATPIVDEYSPEALQAPLAMVKKESQSNPERVPRVAVRKAYFTYFAEAQRFFLPYTDYPGLVRYCRLNDIDYVLLQDNLVSWFPFYERFESDPPDFQRLYKSADELGNLIRLYRFNKGSSTTDEQQLPEEINK
jgi:hypothetical protein